jgi:hypothetical protein
MTDKSYDIVEIAPPMSWKELDSYWTHFQEKHGEMRPEFWEWGKGPALMGCHRDSLVEALSRRGITGTENMAKLELVGSLCYGREWWLDEEESCDLASGSGELETEE